MSKNPITNPNTVFCIARMKKLLIFILMESLCIPVLCFSDEPLPIPGRSGFYYHHATETNLPPEMLKAIHKAEEVLRDKGHLDDLVQTSYLINDDGSTTVVDTRVGYIYRIDKKYNGYWVACRYYAELEGRMSFMPVGEKYISLDSNFQFEEILYGD